MKKLFIAMIIGLVGVATEAIAQEQKVEKVAPAKEAAAPANGDGMKCCEGMEKMGEIKAGMSTKGEMPGDMKVKMEKMKEMMAEKMGEKGVKTQTNTTKVEENQPAKDTHQH